MSDSCTVVIGAPHLIDDLRRAARAEGEVLSFSDRDPLSALETITTRRPHVVVLERLFAATSRGAALINRIKADPALAGAEIRVLSHDGTYSRISPRRTPLRPAAPLPERGDRPAAAAAAPPLQDPSAVNAGRLDYRGTRRAPRIRMARDTEAQVDGARATVVDLSAMGAQILSPVLVKPQQRLRIVLADASATVRVSASVAWVSFEIPKGVSRYRAGVEFIDAEAAAIEAFCARHRS